LHIINQASKKLLIILLLFSVNSFAGMNESAQGQNNSLENEMSAEDVLKLTPESMALRQMQTRVYETKDIKKILDACVGLLQDNGFNVDEISPALGTVLGTKEREAIEAGQVAAKIVVAVIFGVVPATDVAQKMAASVVVSEADSNDNASKVRVNFSRVVWNDNNAVSKAERLEEPEMYQAFFEQLSKSLFLEEQKI
jgi:hypothetical protein